MFANDDALADDLLGGGTAVADPLWRMPLWKPYDDMLASDVADLGNVADAPLAGAVTAALFLQKFVPEGIALGASRHLRLARLGQARAAQGRRRLGLRAAWDMLSRTAMANDGFGPFLRRILDIRETKRS